MQKPAKKSEGLEAVQLDAVGGVITAWRGTASRLQVIDEKGRAFQVVLVARNEEDLEIVARRVVGTDFEPDLAGQIVCCSPSFFIQRGKP